MKKLEILLLASNLHWLPGDPQYDKCVHGNVQFQIGVRIIIDPSEEFTLSASALFLLRTLNQDHTQKHPVAEHLLTCCGFSMFAEEGNDDVWVVECPNGKNWFLLHDVDDVILEFEDGTTTRLAFSAWSEAVLSFADQIEAFYEQAQPRLFYDQDDRTGYEAFWKEWKRRRNEQQA